MSKWADTHAMHSLLFTIDIYINHCCYMYIAQYFYMGQGKGEGGCGRPMGRSEYLRVCVWGGAGWDMGCAGMLSTGGPGIPTQSESMPNALCRQRRSIFPVIVIVIAILGPIILPIFRPRQNFLVAIIKLSGPKIREGGIKRTNW